MVLGDEYHVLSCKHVRMYVSGKQEMTLLLCITVTASYAHVHATTTQSITRM